MTKFSYIINSENGIHARPAGILVKAASEFESEIKLYNGQKEANAKSLFSIMGLGIKDGDKLDIHICGKDEAEAESRIKNVLEKDLCGNEVKNSDNI